MKPQNGLSSSSSCIWLGGDLVGVFGVHLEPGGGVMSGVPGGETISIVVGDFAGVVGGGCTGFGGGVLAGLGW